MKYLEMFSFYKKDKKVFIQPLLPRKNSKQVLVEMDFLLFIIII